MSRSTPTSTLFPYTTLFRSRDPERSREVRVPEPEEHPGRGCVDQERPGEQRDAHREPAAQVPDGVPDLDIHVRDRPQDRKSTRLNSSHQIISYAVFCLKKKK